VRGALTGTVATATVGFSGTAKQLAPHPEGADEHSLANTHRPYVRKPEISSPG
jgi:hypothetical protein